MSLQKSKEALYTSCVFCRQNLFVWWNMFQNIVFEKYIRERERERERNGAMGREWIKYINQRYFLGRGGPPKFWSSVLFYGTPKIDVLLLFKWQISAVLFYRTPKIDVLLLFMWQFSAVLFYGTQFFSKKSVKNSIHFRFWFFPQKSLNCNRF